MAKHKVVATDAEIDRAIARAQGLEGELRVASVEYRPGPGLDLLILRVSDGHRHLIPREDLQGLQSATKEQIAEVEIVGNGTGLHWPALNVDHYVPSLLGRVYGSKGWTAEIGRSAGLVVERIETNEGIRKGLAAIDAVKSRPARKVISAIKGRREL